MKKLINEIKVQNYKLKCYIHLMQKKQRRNRGTKQGKIYEKQSKMAVSSTMSVTSNVNVLYNLIKRQIFVRLYFFFKKGTNYMLVIYS